MRRRPENFANFFSVDISSPVPARIPFRLRPEVVDCHRVEKPGQGQLVPLQVGERAHVSGPRRISTKVKLGKTQLV
jgi:hypothetical protein